MPKVLHGPKHCNRCAEILWVLRHPRGEVWTVTELTEVLAWGFATVNRHMHELEGLGLVAGPVKWRAVLQVKRAKK